MHLNEAIILENNMNEEDIVITYCPLKSNPSRLMDLAANALTTELHVRPSNNQPYHFDWFLLTLC